MVLPMKWLLMMMVSLLVVANVAVAQAQNEVKQKPEKPQARPAMYPFDVKIGGQKAVMQKGNILFAVIEKPVKADALLEIENQSPMLIINAFKVKPNGAVMQPGEQPAIYFVKNAKSVKLNQTMDKKTLSPGRYLLNIVAHGTTARVVFLIEGDAGKLKVPSVKDVFDFLTK